MLQKQESSRHSENEDGRNKIVIPLKSILLFLVSSVVTSIVVDFVPQTNDFNWRCRSIPTSEIVNNSIMNAEKTYAIYSRSANEDHLRHVFDIFEKFGYRRVSIEEKWDVLWCHDYPFIKMQQRMKNLSKQQIVNHFPGCGYLTNKVDLSTTRLPFLPPAFRLPLQRNEFLKYTQQNPLATFVEKHNEHRNIIIKSPDQINLNSNNTFVQEFVQTPFLVDGYKFDIGVYVVITSVNPLRIYIYSGDVLLRFCPVKYYPFNASNIDKYVVGDDYLPTWKLPSLKKYYKYLGGGMRDSFDAYVSEQNLDPSIIWAQVEDYIRITILAKEKDIVNILQSYKIQNFFDLIRFDFIVDEKLKVYLMEANMSPNLSSAHFKQNSLLYEQILYSVFNLVGIGSPLKSTPLLRLEPGDEIISTEKNLATNLNICALHGCDTSCNRSECDLCLPCLSGSHYEVLTKAYREHLHKVNMKRIFPRPVSNIRSFNISAEVESMTKRNSWMTRWFYYKCLYDSFWCH
ncbi:probable tubulin polyglutamylase ttll-15 [Stomoxys calcitrans]|uniref:Uncharacterized protein n=1 Tax=Stomoxys calcitrans TaxID=35570 RepID=A0A1I8PNT0_STOCA|nr:probable tubulin polyglutamylase ttll-15 [Stomoxys calcitrans]